MAEVVQTEFTDRYNIISNGKIVAENIPGKDIESTLKKYFKIEEEEIEEKPVAKKKYSKKK